MAFKLKIKFDDQCLKQDKVTFKHKTVVNIYIVYEINLWPYKQTTDFMLDDYFFGAAKLIKEGWFSQMQIFQMQY